MTIQPHHPALFADPDWHPPLPVAVLEQPALRLDLSASNPHLSSVCVDDAQAFGHWIQAQVTAASCRWAIGGYAEHRGLYAMSPLFGDGAAARSLHLGVDCWLPAGTQVFAARDGHVHSTGNNARFGDYGPTIILAHGTDEAPLHTLYGHLDTASLELTRAGQAVRAGQLIGWLGQPTVNVGWPPHLHFQIIRNLGGYSGDFPGVCAASEADAWLLRCPDPMPLFEQWCADLLLNP